MKLDREDQVFNLVNTNGRRSDLIESYTLYLSILKDLQKEKDYEWSSFPNSLNQYKFYKQTVLHSPEVFKIHPKFDEFNRMLKNEEYYNAFNSLNKESFISLKEGNSLMKKLDQAIEARARHYTSNLVKIGFTDTNRNISPIGEYYLNPDELNRSEFEKILPIDNTNLLILQQILKLRVYDRQKDKFYNPALMAIYILLNNNLIGSKDCLNMVQLLTPEKPISPKKLLEIIKTTNISEFARDYIDISKDETYVTLSSYENILTKEEFNRYFKNRKSSKPVNYYYDFYVVLNNFISNRNQENLDKLYEVYYQNKTQRSQLNRAFGYGNNIFDMTSYSDLQRFLIDNTDNVFFNTETYNKVFYEEHVRSKRYDQVFENSDTLRRILEATGIVSIKNGIMGMEYRELWKDLFMYFDFENNIFMDTNESSYNDYENSDSPDFLKQISVEEILNYPEEVMDEVIAKILEDYKTDSITETHKALKDEINTKFITYIEENYPVEKIVKIISMFYDRSKDREIKKITKSDAKIPTIFEYIIGIAWYYISNEKYNVFDSFNLTMTADFTPVTHAAGGSGDIVVNYTDETIMLEVTLMDSHGQKRGELEPVSRHTINLSAEVEPKKVYTVFVADELDNNTISNWRAQAYYPQESTLGNKSLVEGINILPVTLSEYSDFLVNDIKSYEIINELEESIKEESLGYTWREDVINNLMN